MAGELYPVLTSQPYGPHWGMRHPPGLPASARRAGAAHSALASVVIISRNLWNMVASTSAAHRAFADVFTKVVKHLCLTESVGHFGLPANTFDSPRVSAWGAFQFNAPIWRACTRRYLGRAQTWPWDATEKEELVVPLSQYRDLALEVLAAGGAPLDAARGIRIWHIGSGIYQMWLREAGRVGFERAWERLNSHDPQNHRRDIRTRITNRLTDAGVIAVEPTAGTGGEPVI